MNDNINLKRKVIDYIENILLKYFRLSPNAEYSIEREIVANYNINYIIKLGTDRYVLRLNIEEQSGRANQVEYEHKTLEYLEDYGIAPRPFLIDKSKEKIPFKLLIQEYIPGEHLNYDNSNAILDAAKLLSTLHKIPIPLNNFFIFWQDPLNNSLEEIINMMENYSQRKSRDKRVIKQGSKLITKLEKSAECYSKYYKSKSIIHTDVVNDNFLQSPHGIKIIDWEKARIDDGSYDLCVFLGKPPQLWGSTRLITYEEKNLFLSEYCRKQTIDLDNLKDKVRIRQPFVSLRWILWGAHRTADADEGVIPSELKKFHSTNYKRYKTISAVENIEDLLCNIN